MKTKKIVVCGGGGFIEHASSRHLGSALGVAAGGSQLTTPWRPTRRELSRRARERHVAAFGGEAKQFPSSRSCAVYRSPVTTSSTAAAAG